MRGLFVLMFLLGITAYGIAEEFFAGQWYRNDPGQGATLNFKEIENKVVFSIEASFAANSGEVEGDLVKVDSEHAKSHVVDRETGEVADFSFWIESGNLFVSVSGDMIGAGHSVSYEGGFERRQLTEAEKDEFALANLFGDEKVRIEFKKLAGNDLNYVLQCFFARQPLKSKDLYLKDVIVGWFPGVAPWETGILGISNSDLYLMFVDCREEKTVIRFRTTVKNHRSVPSSFSDWLSDKMEMVVIRD